VTPRRLPRLLVCLAVLGLIWPAAVAAHHFTPTATVSAAVTERVSPDVWAVEVRWDAGCQGATAGEDYYDGNLHLVDLDTGARTYIGGGPGMAASGVRDRRIVAIAREQHLRPELEITCYVTLPSLHGAGYHITVTGNVVTIPPRFGGGGGGGGGGAGSGPGAGGGGDATAPLGAGGCRVALLGTNRPDTLTGGDAGEVVIGFGSGDRMRGEGGHDCLVGGPGADTLKGGEGDDRLVGGRGRDVLIGGDGANAYDAGGGDDVVRARNGRPESVRCGSGRDRAYVDRRDRVRGCELSLVGAGR
jgi:Ca2+-binding RTX toxin-like protein